MTIDELRDIMIWLMGRVQLKSSGDPVTVSFDSPALEEMIQAGLNEEGSKRLLAVSWWDEMVEDIVETPGMCDPDDSAEQVLDYAKDVVSEYIRKRFPLED